MEVLKSIFFLVYFISASVLSIYNQGKFSTFFSSISLHSFHTTFTSFISKFTNLTKGGFKSIFTSLFLYLLRCQVFTICFGVKYLPSASVSSIYNQDEFSQLPFPVFQYITRLQKRALTIFHNIHKLTFKYMNLAKINYKFLTTKSPQPTFFFSTHLPVLKFKPNTVVPHKFFHSSHFSQDIHCW